MADTDSELKTYYGNCHCAAFKFSIKVPELKSVSTCNCSICSRNAYAWIFPIADENLTIERGSIEDLSVYEFGRKDMSHFFCKRCGSSVLGKRKTAPSGHALGINARMLRDITLSSLEEKSFPGGDLDPPYTPPKFPAHPNPEPGTQMYNGNCHCGAVTISVEFKPLADLEVMSCNCSLCSRNGELYIYPNTSKVTIHTGAAILTDYDFLSKESLHTFCSVCGVSVLVRVLEEGDPVCPVNVRTFQGIELAALKRKHYDGWAQGKEYVVT